MQPAEPGGSPPVIAILRGLTPDRADAVGDALVAAGIDRLEVPLNSPDPYASIARLASRANGARLVGAGTVLTADEVRRVHQAGGRLVVAPNCDPRVIRAARALGLTAMPGIATATEAFTAIEAGAELLKLFPAAALGVATLAALREVLPRSARVFAVGGVGPDDFGPWLRAGAAGFGCGSCLYRPEFSADEVGARARAIVRALGALAGAPGPNPNRR